VRRGLFPSREQAQAAIAAGDVLVAGSVADKAARQVGPGEPIVVQAAPSRFVGRGGEKLDAALERFRIAVEGQVALDAGASTGGFTDALLQRGAAHVVAVDVGYGQIHERLRVDPRVTVVERTNIRTATPDTLGHGPFALVVADLSFISLRTVAPALLGLSRPGADVILLVKPQFECGREEAARGRGVVRDPGVWRRVLEEVSSAYASQGAAMMGVMVSPLAGADGNVEFLVHLRPGAAPLVGAADLDALIAGLEAAPS
jgi:23S rRNA (cytidine1920-2'-O)/16S rRNA (cytidine1409-2'-O)-methyltransferase